ncbi:MAG TPA: CoA pyrophosphatase [Candidatus Binatia bacterium]|nr:CoA pyrophosphatase [Candidatus Binatia bacterium]
MTSPLEQRLRRALAHTSAAPPRPVCRLKLPLDVDRLLLPALRSTLRPASVLVPLLRRPQGLTVLLTQRTAHLRSHAGQISFPGGRREDADESAAHAALREAHEEVGLPPDAVEVIGYLDDYPTVSRYLVTPVVGIVAQCPGVRPCAHEVAQVFEVPADFALDPGNFESKAFSRSGLNVPFFELNHGGWRIWGATAGMLHNLAEKLAAVPAAERA